MNVQKTLAFPVGEYQRRAAAVQEQLRSADLDTVLATTMASVCYLTGIESVSPHKFWLAGVVRTPGTPCNGSGAAADAGRPILVCQDFESANALISSWVEPGPLYAIGQDPIEVTADLLRRLGLTRGRIGLELGCYSSLSGQGYIRLRSLLPEAQLIDATYCVAKAMAIKSEVEIQCMRQAGAITRQAMSDMIEAIRPGATDNAVAAAAYQTLTAQGSEYSSYPVIVTAGPRSGVPHSTYHRHPIQNGDPVLMEIAAAVNRYQTPMMRVAVLGKPTPQVQAMGDTCVASVNAMIENIKPGALAGSVAAASQKHVDALPYKVVWHGYFGYSVGLGFAPEWSDHPELGIRVGDQTVLQPGMTFHCSTSLRDIGVCGTTCSETILVTKTGCEVLTDWPRKVYVR